MLRPAPFAYAIDGAVIVCSEGPELLVHDGETEGPLWRRTCDAELVGVHATPTFVVALDAVGNFAWFINGDGSPGHTTPDGSPANTKQLGAPASALAHARDTSLAACVVRGGVLLAPGKRCAGPRSAQAVARPNRPRPSPREARSPADLWPISDSILCRWTGSRQHCAFVAARSPSCFWLWQRPPQPARRTSSARTA